MGTIVGNDELERLLREAATTHPHRVNPRTSDGACLYRSEDGQVICLIGYTLIHKLGFEYNPDWEGREPAVLLKDLGFDDGAVRTAVRWQDDPQKPAAQWGTLLT